jgi:hypothetical protein
MSATDTHTEDGKYIAPNGYVYVKRPDHHDADRRGYVAEHRLVAEEKIGRKLRDGEVVHHVNEDRQDNDQENLQVLTIAEHLAEHRSEDSDLREPGEPNPEIECACGCGQTLKKYDGHNRPRRFIHGHNSQTQDAPTQEAILEYIERRGTAKRSELYRRIDTTKYGVKSAMRELRKKGLIDQAEGLGMWQVSDDRPSDGDSR